MAFYVSGKFSPHRFWIWGKWRFADGR